MQPTRATSVQSPEPQDRRKNIPLQVIFWTSIYIPHAPHRQTDRQTQKEKERQTHTEIDRQTHRDKQTGRGRCTEKDR